MTHANNIKILQWNCYGISKKYETLQANNAEQFDIIILQETLLKNNKFKMQGYNAHVLEAPTRQQGGCITLVKKEIKSNKIANPINCGENTEVLAVEIQLKDISIKIYNIYNHINSDLDLGTLFANAENDNYVIGGDFNAHHAALGSISPTNPAGRNIASMLDEFPTITLLNNGEPTHNRGNNLDLTFISESLKHNAEWAIHPTLTSDHFAVTTKLEVITIPSPPIPPKRNIKKAKWSVFQKKMEEWASTYEISQDINKIEKDLVQAIHKAADAAIPMTKPPKQQYKDRWYYNEEVKQIKNEVNKARKQFRRNSTDENRATLREKCNSADTKLKEIKNNKLLEWAENLSNHTSLGQIWKELKWASGKTYTKIPNHPNPKEQADVLMTKYATRSKTEQLPIRTIAKQHHLNTKRWERIEAACNTPDVTDEPIKLHEVKATRHKGKDTAPGADKITYSMLDNIGPKSTQIYQELATLTLNQKQRPLTWRNQDIQPIPKPKDPDNPRPISLIPCISKRTEKIMVNRLKWKAGELHPNLFAYRKGRGTTDCINSILTTINDNPAVVVCLDLEKAFELASAPAILDNLVKKNIKGDLLAWAKDVLLNRQARVKFQGALSDYQDLENGTPQGGIASTFFFNVLIEPILNLQLPPHVHIFIYADDITIVITGRPSAALINSVLRKIQNKIEELGLKANPSKTKAIAIKQYKITEYTIKLGNDPIQWVTQHQVLGIWLDNQLNFNKEIDHLRQITKGRNSALKHIKGKDKGAKLHIARTFYIQAVRSIVDYAAPTLIKLGDSQISKLEVIQNDAMRAMLRAPMWTRICNLQMEAQLPPLYLRTRQMALHSAIKLMCSNQNTLVTTRLQQSLRNWQQGGATWCSEIAKIASNYGLNKDIINKAIDQPYPQYIIQPPWNEPPME